MHSNFYLFIYSESDVVKTGGSLDWVVAGNPGLARSSSADGIAEYDGSSSAD